VYWVNNNTEIIRQIAPAIERCIKASRSAFSLLTLHLGVYLRRQLVRYGFDDRIQLQAATSAIIQADIVLRTAIRTKHIDPQPLSIIFRILRSKNRQVRVLWQRAMAMALRLLL
jgi:hypothetical protein